MLIHLIRHTKPEIAAGICYGQTDLELASSFTQEADTVLSKLLPHYDAVFTSPLKRCASLAAKIKASKTISDARIMEYNFGDWEMLKWNDFSSDEAKNWMNDFVEQTPPNGENMIAMQERVMDFWSELHALEYENIAVVCHAGVIRLIHAEIFKTPLEYTFRLQLDYGAVIEVQSDLKLKICTIKYC